jgi:hypothetical protein
MLASPEYWFLYGFYLAKLRVDRANHHLADVKRTLRALNREFTARYYDPGDDWSEELGELRAQHIHLIIGDFVSNLRTALNYVAVALAKRDSGTLRAGPKVQFPIESSPDLFAKHRATYLEGVSDEHVTEIKRVQPYNGCEWTKLLQRFSNQDKHLSVITIHHEIVGSTTYRKAKISTGDRCMKMDCRVEVEITFSNGAPVVEMLQELQSSVADFLSGFNRILIDEWRGGRRPVTPDKGYNIPIDDSM